MDACPLGRYTWKVSVYFVQSVRIICVCLCLSPFHHILSSSSVVVFFSSLPRYDVVRVYYKDKLVLQMYTSVHDSFCSFGRFFVFRLLFDHLSIQAKSKQFVYEMCKWDMQRCDRDGIMEKTLIRLYRRCRCSLRSTGDIRSWKIDFTILIFVLFGKMETHAACRRYCCSWCFDAFQENHNVWPLYWPAQHTMSDQYKSADV